MGLPHPRFKPTFKPGPHPGPQKGSNIPIPKGFIPIMPIPNGLIIPIPNGLIPIIPIPKGLNPKLKAEFPHPPFPHPELKFDTRKVL